MSVAHMYLSTHSMSVAHMYLSTHSMSVAHMYLSSPFGLIDTRSIQKISHIITSLEIRPTQCTTISQSKIIQQLSGVSQITLFMSMAIKQLIQ